MKILVTGGTGFTGSALVRKLLSLGHKVKTIDYQKGIVYEQLQKEGAEIIIGSITDKNLVDKATEGMDIVFHVAAAFREMDVKDEHYYNVNVNGTRYVMEAAMKHNIKKVIYCSTQGVHGHINNPPGNENSPIAPEDYYQQTKYEGEVVVQEFIKKGLKGTIIRPTAIYGPGDPERFFMIYKKAKKGFFPMFGKGETFYHPVYIDNLVDAFILSMDLNKGNGETYIIADEEYYPIKELVKRVGKAMNIDVKIKYYPVMPLVIAGHVVEKVCKPFGIAPPIFPRRVDWFRQVRAFKIDKAKKELGYEPKVGIDEGLKNTYNWYIANGYLQ
ncbi:MAG TPA: NAD-dependent epimerase/dehydratase family protein [Ignavibacteriaceae bacterium]|nr:NAD-dependent epimerase/dehydratase family protein [Ignavibacteriaceae bacterium]